eukprot:11199207-Lingulodinium_polyedra.AAC.1
MACIVLSQCWRSSACPVVAQCEYHGSATLGLYLHGAGALLPSLLFIHCPRSEQRAMAGGRVCARVIATLP